MANPTTTKVSNSNEKQKGLENNMANDKITLDNISAAAPIGGVTLSNEIGTWAELDSKNSKSGEHIPLRGKVVRVDPREHAQHGIFQMWLVEVTAPTVYYGDKDTLMVAMPGDIVGVVESTDLQKYHDVVTDDTHLPEITLVALPHQKTGKGYDFKPFKFTVHALIDRATTTASLSMESLKAKFLGAGAGAAKSLPAAS